MSIKRQFIGGMVWTVIDTLFVKGLSLISSLLLARWLGPSEFGLIGMIAVFVAIGQSLIENGLSASLIRTKNRDQNDFSTVFWLNLLLSIIVYIVLFSFAPLIAKFFEQPVLKGLVRLYCVTFIISAFSAVHMAQLIADMSFRKITRLNIPGTILGMTVGLLLGYYDYGAWSIVLMYLTSQFVLSLLLWSTSIWRPSFKYHNGRARQHFGFGYKLMLSGLLNTVFGNIYNVIIGKIYNPVILGYFERSKTFNEYPVTILTSVLSKVTYPLLSNIQDDVKKVGAIYRKILQMGFFITVPIMFLAAAMAHPLFHLVLGEEWMPAVPFFQILCLGSIFYPIHAFNLNVFKVYGRSDLFLRLEIIKKIIIVIAVIIGYQFGIYGLVWSSVAYSYIALTINSFYSARMIQYSQWQQYKDMLPIFLFGGISASVVFLFFNFAGILSDWINLGLGSIIGGVIYLLLNFTFHSAPLYYCFQLIREKQ